MIFSIKYQNLIFLPTINKFLSDDKGIGCRLLIISHNLSRETAQRYMFLVCVSYFLLGHKKSPTISGGAYRFRHRPTLPRVTAVPSARMGLTSLFGMGRGGHHRYRHLNIFNSGCKLLVIRYRYRYPKL